jgi:CubicO group peptidase (beta-lactamase class C family)
MRTRRTIWPSTLAIAIGTMLGGKHPRPSDVYHDAIGTLRARLERTTPSLMREFNVAGVAIAIVNAHANVLVTTFGHVDDPESASIQGTTIFELASLGKPLFCYAVLHHKGAPPLDLDQPIAQYLESPVAQDPLASQITAGQILSHTSGLSFSESDKQRHVLFRPGSQWQYSGLGYSVLQQGLERLWGEPLEKLTVEAVTARLGMKNTSYVSDASQPMLALGHDREGRLVAGTDWSSADVASSLHSTAVDYGRFVTAMLDGLAKGDPAAARMVEPRVEVDHALSLYWGLGWAIAKPPGDTILLHWGSNPGYKSLALASVAQDVGMVVLTNADNGLEIATRLVPVVFGHDYPFLRFYMLHPTD